MNRRGFVLLTLAALLPIASGCISMAIKVPFPQKNRFERMVICTDVEEKKGLFSPLDITSDFNPGNERVICLVRLQEVDRDVRVGWRWYDPDGRLVRDIDQFIYNEEGLSTVRTLYDLFPLSPELKAGTWTVVFYLEGKMAASGSFLFKINIPFTFSNREDS
ncbi:MAG: hypothetical protein ABIK95_03345 [Acidobacteriota bacterium]